MIHENKNFNFKKPLTDGIAKFLQKFLLSSTETSACAMTFSSYELAMNQDIQDKLRKEINEVLVDKEVTFEAINDMKYLDMVFNETLRKYSVLDVQMRQSTSDFVIPNSDLIIPGETLILIPTYALHNDERFWENPDKFDPERFTAENVQKRRPFTFIPFSDGPRQCTGLR